MTAYGEVAVYQAELIAHPPSGPPIDLGGLVSYSPRRAVRWMRTRAEQAGQQLGAPYGGGVRAWLRERAAFEAAVGALVAGTPLSLTVVDADGCTYALVARPGGLAVGAYRDGAVRGAGRGMPQEREAAWLAA
ncbi:hypothetical protein [Streptomyces sp. NPDC093097]|uniref:hypothetical protein n=1 Tax=Streptomyces sp. NPDC093097 TaxID=3366027 RepID=UPI0037FE61CC